MKRRAQSFNPPINLKSIVNQALFVFLNYTGSTETSQKHPHIRLSPFVKYAESPEIRDIKRVSYFF